MLPIGIELSIKVSQEMVCMVHIAGYILLRIFTRLQSLPGNVIVTLTVN